MIFVSDINFKSPSFYAQLAIVPAFTGLVLLLLYWIVTCFASCGRKNNRYVTSRKMRRTTGLLGLFGVVACACAALLVVVNNQDISDGIDMAFDVSADVESRFHIISSDSESLRDAGHSIVDATQKLELTCEIKSKELDDIVSSVNNYLPKLEDVCDDTNDVANDIDTVRSKSDPYAHHGRRVLLWGISSVVLSIVFLNTIAFLISTGCCRSTNSGRSCLASILRCCSLSIVHTVSFVLFLLLTLIIMINIYSFFVVETFCESPNATVLDLVPEGTIYDYTSYYSTSCDVPAPNPVMDELSELQDQLSTIKSNLNEITKACGNSISSEKDIQIIKENLDISVKLLGEIESASDCDEIHPLYVKILNEAICHDIKNGLAMYFVITMACSLSVLVIIFLLMMRRDQKSKRDVHIYFFITLSSSSSNLQQQQQHRHFWNNSIDWKHLLTFQERFV